MQIYTKLFNHQSKFVIWDILSKLNSPYGVNLAAEVYLREETPTFLSLPPAFVDIVAVFSLFRRSSNQSLDIVAFNSTTLDFDL